MLIMCLMRLHLGLAVVDLTNRFQICKTTVSKVFFISVRCEKKCKNVFLYQVNYQSVHKFTGLLRYFIWEQF